MLLFAGLSRQPAGQPLAPAGFLMGFIVPCAAAGAGASPITPATAIIPIKPNFVIANVPASKLRAAAGAA